MEYTLAIWKKELSVSKVLQQQMRPFDHGRYQHHIFEFKDSHPCGPASSSSQRLRRLVPIPLRRPKLLVLDMNGLLLDRIFIGDQSERSRMDSGAYRTQEKCG